MRRGGWVGGKVRSHEELDLADTLFWERAGAAARFLASIELASKRGA